MTWSTRFACALAVLSCATAASADFTPEQRDRLLAGQLVSESNDYERGYHRYIGGVSYLIVDDPIERLSATARDVGKIRVLLPFVTKASLVDMSPSGRARIRIEQAMGPVSGGYTLNAEFREGGRFGRFWIDRGADNAIDDAWGFVRLTPVAGGRTLITYGILVDLGNGMLHALFESRIRALLLAMPARLARASR